ncbi:MAG: hypothetical protein LAT66_07255 [Alkalimonas sp.]|nr:hypothetical protein [Alkalimonas sp.]
MKRWQQLSLSAAGLYGAFWVGLAAAAMHLWHGQLDHAAQRQLISAMAILALHTLAILALSLHGQGRRRDAAVLACWHLGSWLFVYTLLAAVFQLPFHVGRLAPIGGQLLIVGWLLLAFSPWFRKTP